MARWTQRNTFEAYLRCTGCGNIAMIHRRRGRERSPGHTKHLWCYRCQDRIVHTELEAKEAMQA